MKILSYFQASAFAGLALQAGVVLPAKAVNYSNDPMAPTPIQRDAFGRYVFSGQVAGNGLNTNTCGTAAPPVNCRDFVTINVPRFLEITKINLDYYNSTDDRAFVAVQAGSTYAGDLTVGGIAPLAFNHFGFRGLCATNYGALRPSAASFNYNCTNGTDTDPVSTPASTDLFTNVLASSGSPVISSPLATGDYTFWIQQVSGDSEYRFTVSTASVPGPLPLLGASGALGWARRLRRRINVG